MSKHLEELTRNREIKARNGDIEDELDNLGVISLRDFFIKHPSAWADLKRKIHAHRSSEGSKFFIKKEKEEYLLGAFLRLKREIDGENIEQALRDEIFSNGILLEHAGKAPSILDSSHGNLKFMEKSSLTQKTTFIKKMLELGIQGNLDISSNDEQVIQATFIDILPAIIHYLKSLFNLTFEDLPRRKDIGTMSAYLTRKIWNKDGTENSAESKKAWVLVKAFTAWGSYKEIENIRTNGASQIKEIGTKLNGIGIISNSETPRTETSGPEVITIYPGTITVPLDNGDVFTCPIEYRLKSMRSILLKMWENEDYNNVDAMRDIIGIAVIWSDNTPEDTKIQIIGKFTRIMSDKGYLLKNKGLISQNKKGGNSLQEGGKDGISLLTNYIKKHGKKPLGGIVSHKKGKTDDNFQNTSISGFTGIDGNPVGLEIQFFDQSKYDFWKNDHYSFDPLKIINAWSRGSWFLTPHQALYCVQEEIPRHVLDDIIKKRPQEILYTYLQKGKLIPYVGEKDELYFVPISHENSFLEKFGIRNFRKIVISRPVDATGEGKRNKDLFKEYILNLKTRDALNSTPGISSLPHVQDR